MALMILIGDIGDIGVIRVIRFVLLLVLLYILVVRQKNADKEMNARLAKKIAPQFTLA